MSFCISNVHAQLLKKLKDKVNKTVENAAGTGSKPGNDAGNKNSGGNEAGGNKSSGGNDAGGNNNSSDDVSNNPGGYSLSYSSPLNFKLMYDESTLRIKRKKLDYRLILQQSVDKKIEFVIVDNGQVTSRSASLSNDQIMGGIHQAMDGLNGGAVAKTENYIIADSTSLTVQGQDSKTFSVPKADENQITKAYEMMKKTDEYKKMSPEEKKELEEQMKQTPEIENMLSYY